MLLLLLFFVFVFFLGGGQTFNWEGGGVVARGRLRNEGCTIKSQMGGGGGQWGPMV